MGVPATEPAFSCFLRGGGAQCPGPRTAAPVRRVDYVRTWRFPGCSTHPRCFPLLKSFSRSPPSPLGSARSFILLFRLPSLGLFLDLSHENKWTWWSTHTQVASVACTSKRAATKPAGAAPKAAADKPKRPSRARKAVPVQAPVGGFSPPASTSKEDGDHGAAAAAVRSKLVAMHARFRGELSFLVTEFTKMEVQLSLEVGVATPVSSGSLQKKGRGPY